MSDMNIRVGIEAGSTNGLSAITNMINGVITKIKEMAKAELDLNTTGKTTAAVFNSMARELQGIVTRGLTPADVAIKKTSEELKKFEQISARIGKESTPLLLKEAWAVYSAEVTKGTMTTAFAEKELLKYEKALQKLEGELRLATNVLTGFSDKQNSAVYAANAMNHSLDLETVTMLRNQKALELTSNGFKILKESAYEYLITDKDLIAGVKSLQSTFAANDATVNRLSLKYNELLKSKTDLSSKAKEMISAFREEGGDATALGISLGKLNKEWAATEAGQAKIINKSNDLKEKYTDLLNSTSKQKESANLLFKEYQAGDITLGVFTQKLSNLNKSWNTELATQNRIIENSKLLKVVYSGLLGDAKTSAAGKGLFAEYEKGLIPLNLFKVGLQNLNKTYQDGLTAEKKKIAVTTEMLDLYPKLLNASSAQTTEAWKLLNAYDQTGKGASTLKINLRDLNREWVSSVTDQRKVVTSLKEFEKTYTNLINSMSVQGSKARDLFSGFSGKSSDLKSLKIDLAALNKEYLDIERNSQRLSQTYGELFRTQGSFGNEVRTLLFAYRQGRVDLDALTTALAKYSKEMKTAESSGHQMNNSINNLTTRYKELFASQSSMGREANNIMSNFKKTGDSVKVLEAEIRRLNSAHVEYGHQVNTVRGASGTLERTFQKLINSMQSYARYMISSTILQSMASGFNNVTEEIMSHDQALHDLSAITQASNMEIQLLDKTLMDVATNTKYTLTELADGMKVMAQAGYSVTEITSGIQNIGNLATGAMESLSTTINLVTSTMATFDIEMGKSAQVADMFANAVTGSRLTISGLNTTMSYLGPAAVNANIPLTDLMSTLMELSQAGMRASTQGTGMTEFLSKLANPTEALTGAIKEAGFALDDFNPQLVSWRSILEKLPKLFDGTGEAIQQFGVRGSRVALALKTQGIEAFDKYRSALERSGTAADMAAKSMEGLKTLALTLMTNLNILGVETLKSLVEPFRLLLSVSKDVVAVLTEVAKTGIGQLLIQLSLVATAFAIARGAMSLFAYFNMGARIATWITALKAYSLALLMGKSAQEAVAASSAVTAEMVARNALRKAMAEEAAAKAIAASAAKAAAAQISAARTAAAAQSALAAEVAAARTLAAKAILAESVAMRASTSVVFSLTGALKGLVLGFVGVVANIAKMAIAHPVIAAAAVAVTALGVPLLLLKKQTDEVIQKNAEFSAGLKTVQGELGAYKTAVEKHGASSKEAKDALETLKKSLTDTGEQVKDTSGMMGDFSQRLKGMQSGSRETADAIDEIGNALDESLKEKTLQSVAAVMKMERAMLTLKQAFSWIWEGKWSPILGWKLIFENLVPVISKVGNKLKETTVAAVAFLSTGHTELVYSIGQASKSLEELQKKAKEGSTSSANSLEVYRKGAGVIVAEMRKVTDITKLTREEQERYLMEQAKLNEGWSPALVGAVLEEMKRVTAEFKTQRAAAVEEEKAIQSMSGIVKKLSTEINAMEVLNPEKTRNYIGDLNKLEDDYRAHKLSKLDEMNSRILQASAAQSQRINTIYLKEVQDYTNIQNQKIQEVEDFYNAQIVQVQTGSEEEKQLQAEKEAAIFTIRRNGEAKYKELIEQRNKLDSANLQQSLIGQAMIVDAQRKIFLAAHKDQLADLAEHASAHKAIYDEMLAEETRILQRNLDEQNKAADSLVKSDSQKLLIKTQNQIEYYQKLSKLEDDNLVKVRAAYKEKNDSQEQVNQAIISGEKKANESILDLAEKQKTALYKVSKDRLKDEISSLTARLEKHKSMINNLKSLEVSLTNQILAEQKKRKGIAEDTDDAIRENRYLTMRDEEVQAAEENRLRGLEADLKSAYIHQEGEKVDELSAKVKELAQAQIGRLDKEKMGQSAYNSEVLRYNEYLKTAGTIAAKSSLDAERNLRIQLTETEQLKKAEEEKAKTMQETLQQTMARYEDLTGVSVKALTALNEKMEDIMKKDLTKGVVDFKEKATEAVQPLNNMEIALNAILTRQAEEIVKEKELLEIERKRLEVAKARAALPSGSDSGSSSSSDSGSSTPGYSKGVVLPGYGGGDRFKARLEAGEGVLTKEVVRHFGRDVVSGWNKGIFREMRKKQIPSLRTINTVQILETTRPERGTSDVLSKLKDFGIVNFKSGDVKVPALVHKDVFSELQRYMKRESLMGAN